MAVNETYHTDFSTMCQVYIDADQTIKATVTAHVFREHFEQLEVSWFANGVLQTQYVDSWRCTLV